MALTTSIIKLDSATQFCTDIFEFLHKSSIQNPAGGKLFFDIDWVGVSKAWWAKQVSVSFRLTDKPCKRDLIRVQREQQTSEWEYKFGLSQEEKSSGEQTFLYTFSSFRSFEKNTHDFLDFIEKAFATSEEIAARNVYFWDLLQKSKALSKKGSGPVQSLQENIPSRMP